LDLLISGVNAAEDRNDSATPNPWSDNFKDSYPPYEGHSSKQAAAPQYHDLPQRQHAGAATFNLASGSGPFRNGQFESAQTAAGAQLRVPGFSRQVSFGAPPSSVPEDGGFDDADSLEDDGPPGNGTYHQSQPTQEQRTLYFAGFAERTTIRDLLSLVKGGKLLSINLRPERSATVTFLANRAASDFLAWAKKHDIYLHAKRASHRFLKRA
jgi:hypothetical protein